MKLNEYIKSQRGLAAKLAKDIGVFPPDISMWANGKISIPQKYGAQIEIHTNGLVTRKELFPTDWESIWPELKDVA